MRSIAQIYNPLSNLKLDFQQQFCGPPFIHFAYSSTRNTHLQPMDTPVLSV